MALYGLLRRWEPEWRMRRLLEEVERLLVTPDEKLIDEFEAETAQMLHGGTASVRKEDQLRINEFGRNNAALHDIREQKKTLKDSLDTLDDANTDLMMGEGDNVQYVNKPLSPAVSRLTKLFIGESFVEASEDFAQEYLEKRVEVRVLTGAIEANAELRKLEAEEAKLVARQAVLKKMLYSRFGQSINLEDS
ncbi:hypothetical protein BBJ28_00005543 [Nothophytophthora sp. Chile5]|nr:hypothetical protein BBJ28_00005543 [Nothophytophthora sp. Chile5]